jgi:hypothetical protein
LKCEPSHRHSPVPLLSTTSPGRGQPPWNSDPTSATTEGTLHEKRRVWRTRVFSPVNSHASGLSLSPTTWWWCGWHDETWTWWRDSPWTFVRRSEAFKLNFLWYPLTTIYHDI